ncbi:MFS transporter [Pontiellaceae bacterium B12227]|nr:MFS transporter [Pontiellaceae bacterium B12227]
MTTKHPVHKASPDAKVSMLTRVGWGFGGLADNYMLNVLNLMFFLVYVNYFKMPAGLAGAALAIPRFVDMITDPVIGNLSDNTRSRWGRRRPYMVLGAVLCAVLLPLFWVQVGSAESEIWMKNPMFIYASVLGILFAIVYTLYIVPYTALGFELTNDYDEKTRVLAWRMYIGLIGSMTVPWVYKLSQLDTFANEAQGAFWVSIGIGVIVIVAGLIPVFVCREREDIQMQKTAPLIPSVKAALTNGPFVILLVAYLIIITGLFCAGTLGSFVNIYYVCGGNKDFGALIVAISGTLGAVVSYFSMFLLTAVSTRFEKRNAMLLGLGMACVGAASLWFTMDPRWPLLQLISAILVFMGLQGCWLMVSSMVADVCDEDELKSGMRREGMFGAVNGFVLKGALTITAALSGTMLYLADFDATETDAFEERTIASVIQPVRDWEFGNHSFVEATEEFKQHGDRFELIANDKSAVEGSKWSIMARIFAGETSYYRWYEFEDAVNAFLSDIQTTLAEGAGEQSERLKAYVETVESVYLVDMEKQKKISARMKVLIIAFQAGGLGLAMIVFWFYPINRARAEETRRKLDERKANEN